MTQGQQGQSLYATRTIPVPRSIKGAFRNFKTFILWLSFAVYFLLPWMPWDRNGSPSQSILFDIPGRRYMIFDLVVYPQDVFWLSMVLFIAAVILFFATALVGRAFCGYFCFQTIWTDAFILIEQWMQGERPARLKLQREPWTNPQKLLRVGGTRILWGLLSFWSAVTFVLYFSYAPKLVVDFFTFAADPAAYVTILTLTITTYLAAGFLREHVCTFICPYGRFQSAMYDPETLTVHYDKHRGEGESGRALARSGLRTLEERRAQGHGDCIDCGLCVQVCPVGIDIRNGLQYTCISCGLCVDACNSIMDKMHYPRGLVRYDSETNLVQANPAKPYLHWKRLKVIGYAVSIVLMVAYLGYDIAHRNSFEHSVQQVRQPLYVVLSDGSIRNRYHVRLTNISGKDQDFFITSKDLPPGALDVGNFQQVHIRNGKSVIIPVSVVLPESAAHTVETFHFTIRNAAGEEVIDDAHFFARRAN